MFEYTKKKYSAGQTVWYNRINIGVIDIIIRENPNVDWAALRADKTLRLSANERWVYTYSASTSDKCNVGVFNTKEAAANKLLQHQYNEYEQITSEETK